MAQQEASGQVLTVGDFVKFPNSTSGTPGAQHASIYGVYCGQNGNFAVVNVPLTSGSNTMYRNVLPTSVVVVAQVSGPANTGSNK